MAESGISAQTLRLEKIAMIPVTLRRIRHSAFLLSSRHIYDNPAFKLGSIDQRSPSSAIHRSHSLPSSPCLPQKLSGFSKISWFSHPASSVSPKLSRIYPAAFESTIISTPDANLPAGLPPAAVSSPFSTMFSNLAKHHVRYSAWPVDIFPSCPVFMHEACQSPQPL